MIKLKNKTLFIVGILVLLMVLIITYYLTNNTIYDVKEYKTSYYSFKYDTSWKLSSEKNYTKLIHKKSKGKITVSYKVLDTYLIDVELKDFISDLVYEIDKQNDGYDLINKKANDSGSYELLYEKDEEECLVFIYKQDNIIMFVYYNTDTNYFDVTMDSYELIVNSLKVYSGEKV